MNIVRTDSRERGTPYNQHHGSKHHREQAARDQSTQADEDAIDISLAALAAAAESELAAPAAAPATGALSDSEGFDHCKLPHIDIKV